MNVVITCQLCDMVHELTVNVKGFACWNAGESIQDALPELSADDRELLISGTCGTCFDELFPTEDE